MQERKWRLSNVRWTTWIVLLVIIVGISCVGILRGMHVSHTEQISSSRKSTSLSSSQKEVALIQLSAKKLTIKKDKKAAVLNMVVDKNVKVRIHDQHKHIQDIVLPISKQVKQYQIQFIYGSRYVITATRQSKKVTEIVTVKDNRDQVSSSEKTSIEETPVIQEVGEPSDSNDVTAAASYYATNPDYNSGVSTVVPSASTESSVAPITSEPVTSSPGTTTPPVVSSSVTSVPSVSSSMSTPPIASSSNSENSQVSIPDDSESGSNSDDVPSTNDSQ